MDIFFICSSYHCINAADVSILFCLITWMDVVLEPVIESHITVLQDGTAEERHGKCIYHACILLGDLGNHHICCSHHC